MPGYYRGDRQCKPCAEGNDKAQIRTRVRQALIGFGIAAFIVLVLIGLFLVKTGGAPSADRKGSAVSAIDSRLRRKLSSAQAHRRLDRLGKLTATIGSKAKTTSTLGKILLGYVQCICVLRRFDRVRWPSIFGEFLGGMQRATLELYDL